MLPLNLKLKVAYEGTRYFGWQKTSTGPSIEQELESVLQTILRHPIHLQAASRTDRWVHALGQIVNFHTVRPDLDMNKLLIGINALLPPDIAILSIEEAKATFHPTLDVKQKVYCYDLCTGIVQIPQRRLFSWHFHSPLRLDSMRKAAQYLIGTHDFSAFCNQKNNEEYESHERTLEAIEIDHTLENQLRITVKGNHFLYKMVRNIVGTLAYIGCGKLSVDAIESILRDKDRTRAGVTAPAHGLTLHSILY